MAEVFYDYINLAILAHQAGNIKLFENSLDMASKDENVKLEIIDVAYGLANIKMANKLLKNFYMCSLQRTDFRSNLAKKAHKIGNHRLEKSPETSI